MCQECTNKGMIVEDVGHYGLKADPYGRDIQSPIPRPDLVNAPLPVPGPGFPGTLPPNVIPITLNSRDVVKELDTVFTNRTPRAVRWLYNTWNAEREAIKFQEIGNALTTGKIDPAWIERWREDYSRYVVENLRPDWNAAAEVGRANVEGGILAQFGFMEGSATPVEFPGRWAVDWMDTRGTDLAVLLTDNQRKATSAILTEFGIRQGLGERELARYIRPTIGLTPNHARAVGRFRNSLIEAAELSPGQINDKVNAYSFFLQQTRAKMIARTEMVWAYNMGQIDAVREYTANGWIPDNMLIVKEWFTSPDERTCPWCNALNGVIVGIDGTYPGMTEKVPNTFAPPAHPNCRCAINVLVVTAAQLSELRLAA